MEDRKHLNTGGRLRVKLANGTMGGIYIDHDYYIGESVYMFYSDWAGCSEPICSVKDAYLEKFLHGASITQTDSIYA